MMKLVPNTFTGWLFSGLRILVALYILSLIALFFFQEKLIFHPSKLDEDFKFDFRQPFEEKSFEFEGSKISSLHFKAPNSKGVILYFHGNAGALDDWGEVAEDLSGRTDWDVWTVDYPGYGKSEGAISSEEQLHALASAFRKKVVADLGSQTKMIIFGRSIGTGIATQLARENVPAGLILESPYRSLPSLARSLFPWVPTSLLKYDFDNESNIAKLECPIFIVQGTNDEVIPFSHGERLATLNKHTTFIPIAGGHHNDLSNFPVYWQSLGDWIKARGRDK